MPTLVSGSTWVLYCPASDPLIRMGHLLRYTLHEGVQHVSFSGFALRHPDLITGFLLFFTHHIHAEPTLNIHHYG